MSGNLGKLENRLGYKFADVNLLERALTHRSWAHENLAGSAEDEIRSAQNETFEFVGDAVLGLVIAEELFLKHPELDEGGLSVMKHHLVSTRTLAGVADSIGLGEFLRVGRSEEKTGGRTKQALLANAMEAVIGAVFFDSGYVKARHFVKSVFKDELRIATPLSSLDYKGLLQETLQSQKLAAPTYRVTRTEGMPHDRIFSVEALWDSGRAEGTGSSIKAAEVMAAREALKLLNGDSELAAKPETED